MDALTIPPRRRLRGWQTAVFVLWPALAGWLVGLWSAPDPGVGYLELQAASDGAHRTALLLLVGGGLGMLLGVLGAWLLRRRALPNLVMLGVVAVSLGVASGTLAHVIEFDGRIEERGVEGQFDYGDRFPARAVSPVLGPYVEERDPGISSDTLPGGDYITLDRRTLGRKRPDGGFRWNRPRPGPGLASLWLLGDELVFAGPGPEFEDDAQVAAFSVDSGERLWAFHFLGARVLPPSVDRDLLVVVAERPSTTAVQALRWPLPERLWWLRLPGTLDLPPRFVEQGVELAQAGRLRRLERDTGRVLAEEDVCGAGAPSRGDRGVECREGRVVAWEPGGVP